MRKEVLTSFALGVWNRLVTVTKPGWDGFGSWFGDNTFCNKSWGTETVSTATERSEAVADHDQAVEGGWKHRCAKRSLSGQR